MPLRFALPSVPLLALIAALAGCPGVDAGPATDGTPSGPVREPRDPPDEAVLELVGDDRRALSFGEESELQVRYLMPDGDPIDAGVVSFALIGSTAGSSLQQLDVVTDDSGMALNTLLAGDQAGSFQVRVAADGAEPLYLDVAVSDQGFGSVLVMANYVGSRFVERRTVVAQADVGCEEAARRPGDPMQTLTEFGPARFVALPAERSYAISVFAEGPGALPMARGCTDGVFVKADREVSVTVTFTDEPLSLDGRFETHFELDSAAPAQVLADAIRQAGTTLVESDANGDPAPLNAEARYLLDVLDRTLRSEQYASDVNYLTLADALAVERLTPTLVPALDTQLQALLDAADAGALSALETLVVTTQQSLAATRLESLLVLAFTDGALQADWQPSTLSALPIGAAPTAPTLELSAAGSVLLKTELMLAADAVNVTSARLPLGWGALAAQSLGVATGADSGLLVALNGALGCGELATLLDSVVWATGQCDASCIDAVCARGLGTLVAGAESALTALDTARPHSVLSGTLVLSDKDGNLWAESLSGALDGTWLESQAEGSVLTAMGSGQLEMPAALGQE
jgi:hypothetical protein